jgi:zinc transport system ATP-binding protein
LNDDGGLPLLELRGVTFGYHGETVLEGVDLAVERRDFLALVGPNGGGKTTLLKILLGFLSPWSGEVIRRLPARRGAIGYVPQFSTFDRGFPLRVEQVVLMGRLGARGLLGRYSAADREAARRALQRMRLVPVARAHIAELSLGQLQRALIARALAAEPDILILDEPTASVDAESRQVLAGILEELNSRIPVVVVTHDIGDVAAQVKRVALVQRTVTLVHPDRSASGSGGSDD